MMSMSMSDDKLVIVEFEIVAEWEKNNLLATSLIGAIIQDRGKRERGMD